MQQGRDEQYGFQQGLVVAQLIQSYNSRVNNT
jgi:hypothetical protein